MLTAKIHAKVLFNVNVNGFNVKAFDLLNGLTLNEVNLLTNGTQSGPKRLSFFNTGQFIEIVSLRPSWFRDHYLHNTQYYQHAVDLKNIVRFAQRVRNSVSFTKRNLCHHKRQGKISILKIAYTFEYTFRKYSLRLKLHVG